MRRSNEPRIYGPYQHGDVWRNHHVVRGSDGKRKTFYDVYPTRELAEAALAGSRSQAQGDTVKAAVDAMLAEMRKAGLASSTIDTAEYRLHHFFQLPKHANRPLRWLMSRGEELYTAAQIDRSADTHQAELALAKQVGDLCVKRRWLRANPFALVEPVGRKTHGSTKPRLRVDESRKLRTYCLADPNDKHRVLALAYLLLGSRASELVKRDVRDLDDGGNLLWINRTKTVAGTRRLVVPEELRGLLLQLAAGKAPDAPLFTREDGTRATRHWAYHHVKRICREAKVPELSPQALRRTQSDLATEAGATAPMIAAHLGQTSSVVTDRSYRDPNVVAEAKQERALRVMQGGVR
jgi:integrase